MIGPGEKRGEEHVRPDRAWGVAEWPYGGFKPMELEFEGA
jgi:hypothetical protein